jgi:hypothetical protein
MLDPSSLPTDIIIGIDLTNNNNKKDGNPNQRGREGEKEKMMLKKFGETLRKEKKIAVKLVEQYNCYGKEELNKNKIQELAEKFIKAYQDRRKLQKKIWGEDNVEDERIQFGGGEKALTLQPSDYKSPIEKYLLIIAQALEISDKILNK